VAYTQLTRFDNCVVAGEFAWDYETPELSLGTFAQNFECNMYRDMRFQYYYSSYAYEQVCEYKSHYNGFEWWTGREWSKNIMLYRHLCNKDDEIKTIDELYQHQLDYFEDNDV